MASVNDLGGIRKWVKRDRWRAPFADLAQLHLVAPCEATRIEIDEVPEVVGEQNAILLWAWIFEDFMTCTLDDGGNVVDDYLKRRGYQESTRSKQYLTSLRASATSLYEVSGSGRDQFFMARDLLRGGEAFRVSEKSGKRTIRQWDRLAARIVKVAGQYELVGSALPFTYELGESVRENFARLKEDRRSEARELAAQGRDDGAIDPFAFDTEILRESAYLFANVWLLGLLRTVLEARLPKPYNNEGDEIAFTTISYPLRETIERQALENALNAMPGLHRESETSWEWRAIAAPASGQLPEGGTRVLTTSFADGSVVMGHVELEAQALTLEANSPQRAQRGRASIEPVIGTFVGEPSIETRTMAETMANGPRDKRRIRSPALPSGEKTAITHETLNRHYRSLLDEHLPMLGGVSPRTAAQTEEGRETLASWLKQLEHSTALLDAHSPMAGYDVTWMWDELGVADLRR